MYREMLFGSIEVEDLNSVKVFTPYEKVTYVREKNKEGKVCLEEGKEVAVLNKSD